MEYAKVKAPSKVLTVKGDTLSAKVLDTMAKIRAIVGATLGPGGSAVLIERQEFNLPNLVTKDGVTVSRSLGFTDPTAHAIMEAQRDAAVRTANEAGDGTTTATILAEAITRRAQAYTKANPKASPQKIVRRLEALFKTVIEPTITGFAIKPKFDSDEGRAMLRAVAKVSANGDEELADAVLNCFDIVGDEGNVTLNEASGHSRYEVEAIDGFPIPKGFEESCAKYHPVFINDASNQRCVVPKPVFILYHGTLHDPNSLIGLTGEIHRAWQERGESHHVVLVACGFSDSVLSMLAYNFPVSTTLNVVPLVAPMQPIPNSQLHFLNDLSAVTGATVFDQVENPLPAPNARIALSDEDAEKVLAEEGVEIPVLYQLVGFGIDSFEVYRFRSNVVGRCDEVQLASRIEELKVMASQAESVLDKQLLEERIGKLSGGIAKLNVYGASNGELREKRDRAEDAVCAVRGAIKHGVLPAGGWALLKVIQALGTEFPDDPVVTEILGPALVEPVHMLLHNIGLSDDEIIEIITKLQSGMRNLKSAKNAEVYDALEAKFVKAFKAGLLDSTPAVLEAIRNSISIASLLGTLGGVVVFARDIELERRESIETNQFLRNANAPDLANDGSR